MTPVIILGGIFSGYFTPSEAAAIAVDYTLLIAWVVYRSLNFRRFYELVVGAGVTSALIMFIIGTAKIFGWGLAFYQIPEAVAKSMIGHCRKQRFSDLPDDQRHHPHCRLFHGNGFRPDHPDPHLSPSHRRRRGGNSSISASS